jgi:hypothetical protein
MNVEGAPQESEQNTHETYLEKQSSIYAREVEKMKKHDGAELEAEQILFRERIAKNGPEVAIAGLQLKIDAAKEQRERFAADGDRFAEEAWAKRQELLESMKNIFCIYCDVKDSPEFAEYFEEIQPWVKQKLIEGEAIAEQKELP